jgi:hypothetical protein
VSSVKTARNWLVLALLTGCAACASGGSSYSTAQNPACPTNSARFCDSRSDLGCQCVGRQDVRNLMSSFQ